MSITERDFSQQLYDLARLLGWLVVRFPTWRPTGTMPGFPDVIAVRGGRVLFAELKAESGRPTPAQRKWLLALVDAGTEVYVWKPSSFASIVQVLR